MFRKIPGQPFKSFALDVLAIIVGLTITFMIDEWRSEQKIRQEEIAILKAILEDLDTDIELAGNAIDHLYENKIQVKFNLLNDVYSDSLSTKLHTLGGFHNFMGNAYTYDNISAETRNSISDIKLRQNLQIYYTLIYGFATDWARLDERLMIERREIMREILPVDGVQVLDYRSLSLDEMEEAHEANKWPQIQWNTAAAKAALKKGKLRTQIYWSIHSDNVIMSIAKERIERAKALQEQIEVHLERIM
jgi:hypothetical protein